MFEKITKPQAVSLLWIVTEFFQKYNLSFGDDVCAHGEVAHKRVYEGYGALDWLWDASYYGCLSKPIENT